MFGPIIRGSNNSLVIQQASLVNIISLGFGPGVVYVAQHGWGWKRDGWRRATTRLVGSEDFSDNVCGSGYSYSFHSGYGPMVGSGKGSERHREVGKMERQSSRLVISLTSFTISVFHLNNTAVLTPP